MRPKAGFSRHLNFRLFQQNRRQADIAHHGLGRLNWADSAPTCTPSGTTGARAKAAIPLRARNSLHRPHPTSRFVGGPNFDAKPHLNVKAIHPKFSAAIEMDLSPSRAKGVAAAEARPIENPDDSHRNPKLESFATAL
jgi:hypothetical protein